MITFERYDNFIYATALDELKPETIVFPKFSLFCYSNDFAVAAAICGRSRENRIYLIDVWEPCETPLTEWLKKWTTALGRIEPVRCNQSGEAAAQLIGEIGKARRGPDIAPIELQLSINKIDGSLYRGWERIVELSHSSVSRRETNVLGGAILGAAKLLGKAASHNTSSVLSRPMSEARQRGYRMPRGVML